MFVLLLCKDYLRGQPNRDFDTCTGVLACACALHVTYSLSHCNDICFAASETVQDAPLTGTSLKTLPRRP